MEPHVLEVLLVFFVLFLLRISQAFVELTVFAVPGWLLSTVSLAIIALLLLRVTSLELFSLSEGHYSFVVDLSFPVLSLSTRSLRLQ